MRKLELSPFVHKVKGQRNWVLCDLLEGRFFQVSPDGDLEMLKKQLLEMKLVFETGGMIPFKYESSMDLYKKGIRIRELQVRVTGNCDLDCAECGSLCFCFKSSGEISDETLSFIFEQFKYIPLDQVSIIGGNPMLKFDAIEKIRENLAAEDFKIMFKGSLDKNEKKILDDLGIKISDFPYQYKEIEEKEMQVDGFSFFFNQEFNPCWGRKIAVDIDGAIKPCLWSPDILGNIQKDNLKKMINLGDFNPYWELTKDKFKECRICEYRYVCPDCRVAAFKETGDINAKTLPCRYRPQEGKWKM